MLNDNKELKAENEQLKSDNENAKVENKELKETLTTMADRQKSIEDMLLALAATPSKEKLAKLDKINMDGVQKTIQ